ncbi:MAG: hypothetical protein AUK44_04835 [Porphyromonadaceae bacterium CG2_30_38_12]|nr:MAG: hypothetical protein AUK44_04835 [Porphyromonadaceae bacterium CG2_30_38_12]
MKTKKLLLLQAFFMLLYLSALGQTIAPGDTLKINFQPTPGTQPGTSDAPATAVPSGYFGDFGLVYQSQNSFTYGWDVDCSAAARQRSSATGPTYNTIQFQSGSTKLWKISLNPGKYNVKIVAGDAYNTDSNNEFLLNNGMVLTDPTPKSSNFDTYYASVTVAAGGFLSFTGTNSGNNAKVCYIWISKDITPVAAQATSVTQSSFTANWSAVSGADSYQLDVSKVTSFSDPILSESFVKVTTTYNSNKTSVMDDVTQTSGWASDKFYDSEVGNARIGESGASGYLTTPTIDLSGDGGNATLTFDIKKYGTDANTTCRVYHAADGTNFTQVGADITYTDAFSTKTVAITGGTANSKIKISGVGLANNRFHLDNIAVKHQNISGYDNMSVTGTSQSITGLSAGTGYYYRVRSVFSGTGYTNSNTITAITNVTANTSTSTLPTCPTCDITVTDGGTFNVDASKTFHSVLVNAGANLSVADDQTLTLTDLTLKSDATGTSTYVPTGTNKNGTLTVTGTTAVEQYLATTRNWYVSSPVSNAIAPTGYTFYSRDESGSNPNPVAPATAYWVSVATGAGLTAGKGYIALPSTAAVPITFSTQSGGSLNNGTVTIPLTYTSAATSGKGYNLIGNPYPSHLSWTYAFTQANATKIESSIWYRTNSGSSNASGWSFVTFNPTSAETVPSTTNGGIIPPMQAFWVLAKDVPGNSIQFTNAMRSHQTGNPLRTPAANNTDRKKIRLQLSNGSNTDEALILFDANAADGYDAYDSPKMMNDAADIADIYTVLDAKKLVINGMNAVSDNLILPLGYNAGAAGSLTLKVSEMTNFDSNTRVYLVDGASETELAQGTEYSFNTAKITGNESRFSLFFRAPGATTGIENANKLNAQVFVNDANQITMVAPEKSKYAIYNAVGQKVIEGTTITTLQTVSYQLQTGIYVVKLIGTGLGKGKELTTRVIVK